MPTSILTPRLALNKAFLKVKPNRRAIEMFRAGLLKLLDRVDFTESEEFHKNLVADFLKQTYYAPDYFINTKGRNDLVIHTGKNAKSPVGVIIEAKKPGSTAEMVRQDRLNTKALQELVLYYLRERVTQNNLDLKHLAVTNIQEWFVFDAATFEKAFVADKALLRQFADFEAKRLSGTTTDFFYKEIAAPAISAAADNLTCTYFNLLDFKSRLQTEGAESAGKLIPLFKFFSPEHLLKLPFANDSNSLDKTFYAELLHIIGLTETKQKGKKIIERKPKGRRDPGSLLENTINQLETLDVISRMKNIKRFGDSHSDRLFHVALELVITWINRVLFLKLLEAQLITYHKGDAAYGFLNGGRIPDFDSLNSLFFQVLARNPTDRDPDVQADFSHVPYLNSSLFEPSEIEQTSIFISNLRDGKTLPLLPTTVLKDGTGKRRAGGMNTLHYLFAFLDAYDFAGEGAEEIQDEHKSLINASVLGLIFEKINGYKEGSFFTPGFITMRISRDALRRAVVRKFNDANGWHCRTLDDVYDRIEDREEANKVVNSLKICDPAVGSGHFLVSALNELIAVKHEMKILRDRQGRRLKEYAIEVVNDELVITDDDGELFEYHPQNPESQRVQETLFHEKQTLIENCLFGVDVNPNSVKICRLRLWIELLKNAYYKTPTELETLPNIDINIKQGNSLIRRFPLDADLSRALRKSKWTIIGYRLAVQTYRKAHNKAEKREMERLMAAIKNDFRSDIASNDPKMKRLRKLQGELSDLTHQYPMFELTKKEKAEWTQKVKRLTAESQKLEEEIEAIRNNKIYENAFEWRFEFPEVLDEKGDFVGFDVVIGNPPYIRQEELKDLKSYLKSHFQTFKATADLYVYFIEQGLRILRDEGEFAFIVANKWMRAGYGDRLRHFIQSHQIQSILDFGDLPVFEEATTYPCILEITKAAPKPTFSAANIDTLTFPDGLEKYLESSRIEVLTDELHEQGWTLTDAKAQKVLAKLRKTGIPLGKYVKNRIYRGVLTGLNEAFVIDDATRHKLIAEDPKSAEVIKPFLAGRDIKRYQQPNSNKYLIFTRRGIDIDKYPAILRHLAGFREKLEPRPKDFQGKKWQGRKPGSYKWYEIQDAVDYYQEFEKDKIIIPAIVKSASYSYDKQRFYSNDKTTIIPTPDFGLLGLLNSKLIDFYLKNIASTKQNGYFEYKPVYISQLPIAQPPARISALSNRVQKTKEKAPNADTSAPEREIDVMVFKLYGLSYDEALVVAPDFWMSRKSYESITPPS